MAFLGRIVALLLLLIEIMQVDAVSYEPRGRDGSLLALRQLINGIQRVNDPRGMKDLRLRSAA